MSSMFDCAGMQSTTWTVGDLSEWDTSSTTYMNQLFKYAGNNTTMWSIGDISGWDTSSVEDMSQMFYNAGRKSTTWGIGDLSNWNTSNVSNMNYMFGYAGILSSTWESIGTLKVYATNIFSIFYGCRKAKATLNIFSNPLSGNTGYDNAFHDSATSTGSLITVNYASTTTNIDNIIATKSATSNVVKGSVLS